MNSLYRIARQLITYRPLLMFASGASSWAYFAAPLLFGLLLREFFDALEGGKAFTKLWRVALLYFGTRLFVQGIEQAYAATYAYWEGTLRTVLKANLMDGLLRSRLSHFSSGEVLNRMEGDSAGVVAPVADLVELSGQAFAATIAIVILVTIDPLMTLVAVAPIGFTLVLINRVGKRIEAYRQVEREASSRAVGFLTDILGAVQVVKVTGAQKRAAGHFGALGDRRRNTAVRAGLFVQFIGSLNSLASHLATGCILFYSASRIENRTLSVGDFVLFVSYVSSRTISVSTFSGWVGRVLVSLKSANVALRRLEEAVPDRVDLGRHRPVYLRGPLPLAPAIVLEPRDALRRFDVCDLQVGLPNTSPGLRDVTFSISKGERVVITGGVGSGKTVLLEALLGQIPVSGGCMIWNDGRIQAPMETMVPPRCGYVAQSPCLFSDSLKENILLGMDASSRDLERALQAAELEQDLRQLDAGVDTLVGPKGARLSGGQRLRVALARALVRRPELLFLDDLGSGLDDATECAIWGNLRESLQQTCIAVSHRRSTLESADRVVVLQAGVMVAEGALEALLAKCRPLQEIWTSGSRDST